LIGEGLWLAVSEVRARIVREAGIEPSWPGKNRLNEIRKALYVYIQNEESGPSASEKVIKLIQTYNDTCQNVVTGSLGYSIDESLIAKSL
jgi:hypothetical protein